MPIDFEHLMSLRVRGERIHYSDRDNMLYALGVGLGRDPARDGERAYVAEHNGLKTLPSFASVLAGINLLDDCGWNAGQVVTTEEDLRLDRPLDEYGTLLLDADVTTVIDRGDGALITVESRARRERDGQALFTVRRTWLARGDGGFGGPRGSSPPPHPLPKRPPDMSEVFVTRPEQSLLFRVATPPDPRRRALKTAPPGTRLDELCLQGIACHAILQVICDYDHTLIRSLAVCFAGPAHAGESLVAELWQDANIVSCRLRVLERDAVVLDHGRCVLAA